MSVHAYSASERSVNLPKEASSTSNSRLAEISSYALGIISIAVSIALCYSNILHIDGFQIPGLLPLFGLLPSVYYLGKKFSPNASTVAIIFMLLTCVAISAACKSLDVQGLDAYIYGSAGTGALGVTFMKAFIQKENEEAKKLEAEANLERALPPDRSSQRLSRSRSCPNIHNGSYHFTAKAQIPREAVHVLRDHEAVHVLRDHFVWVSDFSSDVTAHDF